MRKTYRMKLSEVELQQDGYKLSREQQKLSNRVSRIMRKYYFLCKRVRGIATPEQCIRRYGRHFFDAPLEMFADMPTVMYFFICMYGMYRHMHSVPRPVYPR